MSNGKKRILNKTKLCLIILLNISFLALMVCSSTFAWLIANKKVTDLVEVESGSLSIDSIVTTAYRYGF